MPYCYLSSGTKIFYRRYGHGNTKVLLIIGLAATHEAWGPQIKGLTGSCEPNDDETAADDGGDGIEVCCFDNRGVGRSSIPAKKSEYSTTIMAKDALALLDHLHWSKSHVFGHSMGSMIACKLAAIAPERLHSLALLNATGGGFQCFPKDFRIQREDALISWPGTIVMLIVLEAICRFTSTPIDVFKFSAIWLMEILDIPLLPSHYYYKLRTIASTLSLDRQMLSLVYRFLRAKTPEQRAAVDLETHYTKEYLEEEVGSSTRREILHQEYVKAITSSGMQSSCGFEGQVSACWTHKLTSKELDTIRSAGFLISVIHGRYDIIAQLYHARKLAENLQPAARLVELHGGHLVSHERPHEVNQALMALIKATKSKLRPEDWTNLIQTKSGWAMEGTSMAVNISRTSEGANYVASFCNLLGKLQFSFLYIIGVFVMGFKHLKTIATAAKPVRVSASS